MKKWKLITLLLIVGPVGSSFSLDSSPLIRGASFSTSNRASVEMSSKTEQATKTSLTTAMPIVASLYQDVQNEQGQPDLNEYVVRAVEKIYSERSKGGYHIGSAYTGDLTYGEQVVKATPKRSPEDVSPRRTMCVAAVGEVMIEAINLYVQDSGDPTPYLRLPASTWMRGTLLSFKPYLFMQTDSRGVFNYQLGKTPSTIKDERRVFALARGTGHAMSIFGIGVERDFNALKKGDFVNFNRSSGSGHAVVFLSYIGSDNKYTSTYNSEVIGFHYFSAQGKGKPDAGFGYRDAYFRTHSGPSAGGYPKDSAIRSQDRLYLNGGRLWTPSAWAVEHAQNKIQQLAAAAVPATKPRRAASINELLESEMAESSVNFSGEEG